MADLSQTAANVRVRTGASVENFTAGATLSPGDVVYLDSADDKVKLANHTSSTLANAKGMATGYAADGDLVEVVKTGSTVNVGATAVQGTTYFVSVNNGKFAVEADIGTGDFTTKLGVGRSDGDIDLAISASGIAKP